jgi:hypothetical protein
MPYVMLTEEELVKLGTVQDKAAQAHIDRILARQALMLLGMNSLLASVVQDAMAHGILNLNMTNIVVCSDCGARSSYYPYLSGPRKGQPNHSKPKKVWGVEIGSTQLCSACYKKLVEENLNTLMSLPVEVNFRGLGDNGLRRYPYAKCNECGWTGHQGQMRPLHTMMGNGYYGGGCPSCSAQNSLFLTKISIDSSKWVVAPAADWDK